MIDKILSHGGTNRFIFSDSMSGVFPSTPSCAVWNNKLIVNIRCLNYFYPAMFGKISDGQTCNYIGVMDDDLIGLDVKRLPDDIGPYKYSNIYTGREDVRLVVWNNKLYGYACRPDIDYNKVIIELIEFDKDLNMRHLSYIRTDHPVEKNWMAIEDKPFYFMYNVNTAHIIKVNPISGSYEMRRANKEIWGMSGSTNLIKYRGHYMGLVHRRNPWPNYEHRFIVFDKDFNPVYATKWFKFGKFEVEFSCGMCIYQNQLIITYSLCDAMPQMLTIPLKTLDWILGFDIAPYRYKAQSFWQPQYMGDIYQDLSLQIINQDRDGILFDLEHLNLDTDCINKLII